MPDRPLGPRCLCRVDRGPSCLVTVPGSPPTVLYPTGHELNFVYTGDTWPLTPAGCVPVTHVVAARSRFLVRLGRGSTVLETATRASGVVKGVSPVRHVVDGGRRPEGPQDPVDPGCPAAGNGRLGTENAGATARDQDTPWSAAAASASRSVKHEPAVSSATDSSQLR